jgi:hypothetical protein
MFESVEELFECGLATFSLMVKQQQLGDVLKRNVEDMGANQFTKAW